MKPITTTLILLLYFVLGAKGQFHSNVSYKHNEVDGWIKVTETYWYVVDQTGDTTFYSKVLEETDQENPNDKPKYEFDGLGNIVKPDTVKITENKINTHQWVDTFGTSYDNYAFVNADTVSFIRTGYSSNSSSYNSTTKYKYSSKYKKPKYKNKKEPKTETFSFITYKRKLWIAGATIQCTLNDFTTQQVIQAKTRQQAEKIFIKQCKKSVRPMNGTYIGIRSYSLGIYEFTQADIIK